MNIQPTTHLARYRMRSLASLTALTVGVLLALSQTARAATITNIATQDVHAQYTDPNVGTGTIVNNITRLECQWRNNNDLRRDPIIRFDITELPSGPAINSVTLRLYTLRGIAGEYLCLAGSPSDWVDEEPAPEGEQVITPGYVSYGATIGTFDPGTAVGYLDITLDPTFVTGNGSFTVVIFKNIKNSAADSQWASTENATVEWRPALIVDYVAGPASYQTRVETLADGSGSVVPMQDLPAGTSMTVYAIARDEANAYITNTPASWSLTDRTGGVVPGDLVVQPGAQSAIFTANGAGTAQILAQGNATNFVPSGVITVVTGPATQVRVEDQPGGFGAVLGDQNLIPGETVTGYAISRDAGGNYLADVAANWSLTNVYASVVDGDLVPAGGNPSMSATFTANLAGSANLHATSGSLASVDSGLISVVRELRWAGAGTVWDNTTAGSWVLASDNATPSTFADGDTVYFDDFGTGNPTLSLVGGLAPRTILAQAYGTGFTLGGAGKITGPTVLDQSGAATLTLLTDNDNTGETVVGGPITLGNGGTTGSLGSGGIRFTATSLLTFNRSDAVTLTNRIYGPNAAATPDLVIQSGTVTLGGTNRNTNARGTVNSGATLILAKEGDRALDTSSAATELTIDSGGTVILGGDGGDQLGSGGVVVEGTLDMQGVSEVFGYLNGFGSIDSTVFGTNDVSLSICQGNIGGDFGGTIKDTGDGVTNKLTLIKLGNAATTQILGGINSYHGATSIAGGTLRVGNEQAIPSGAGFGDVNLSAVSSTLDLNGYSVTINGLNGGNAGSLVTNSGFVATTLTLGGMVATNTHEFAGAIVDDEAYPTSVIKSGPAAQVLSGANSYRGTTTVAAGKLTLTTAHTGTGAISVTSGTALGFVRSAAEASVQTADLTFGAGATTNEFNVGNLPSATSPLVYATNLVLNGTVYVDVAGNLVGPTRLITFETMSGAGAFALNSLPAGFTGQLVTNANSIDLTVNPITGTNLTITAGGGNVTVSWPESYLGWSLQTQTSTLDVGLTTNWTTVPDSDMTNSLQFPVNAEDPAVFYRMFYQTPQTP